MTEIGEYTCPTEVIWCPQDFYWKEWTPWSFCNVNCGSGNQTRTRFCADGIHGGAPCPKDQKSEKEAKECINPRVSSIMIKHAHLNCTTKVSCRNVLVTVSSVLGVNGRLVDRLVMKTSYPQRDLGREHPSKRLLMKVWVVTCGIL